MDGKLLKQSEQSTDSSATFSSFSQATSSVLSSLPGSALDASLVKQTKAFLYQRRNHHTLSTFSKRISDNLRGISSDKTKKQFHVDEREKPEKLLQLQTSIQKSICRLQKSIMANNQQYQAISMQQCKLKVPRSQSSSLCLCGGVSRNASIALCKPRTVVDPNFQKSSLIKSNGRDTKPFLTTVMVNCTRHEKLLYNYPLTKRSRRPYSSFIQSTD